MKVLIVDDREINRKVLSAVLNADGIHTVEAGDGRQALGVLERGPVDCIITDILMPEMDGYQLCQEVRSVPALNSIPIVVYASTFDSPDDERLALQMGADRYLKKPAPNMTLLKIIRNLTSQPSPRQHKRVEGAVVLKKYDETLIQKLEDRHLLLKTELSTNVEKFRQLAENIEEVLWMTNPESTEVIYISPAYELIWGRSCQSLYDSPRDWADAIHPQDRERAFATALEASPKGKNYELEYRIVRPDGDMRWVHVRAFPVKDGAGKVLRVAGTAADITEKKRLWEQYLQSQKLEAVGQLAGGVAHDFNNLLTAIIGLSELSLEALPPNHPVRADLEEIQTTGQRAAQLTKQLLAFSRRQIFEPQRINLNELIRKSEKMLKRIIGEDVGFVGKLDPSLEATFLDPGQIEQVLVNLCVNARDAMEEGGDIVVETSNRSLETDLNFQHFTVPPGRYVVLTVSDTGVGIVDDVKKHLFEPFFTTKPLGAGTGLGLATIYGIVKQSKAYIRVESEPGKGSQFIIYFPVARDAPLKLAVGVRPSETREGEEMVLVVEDEQAVRHLVLRILKAKNYTVLEAANGKEAWEIIKADKHRDIRLVLTDVIMPIMNGKILAQNIRIIRPDLPVLFTSGYPDEILSHSGALDPGIAFLRKPFTANHLAGKVREVLDSAGVARGMALL